jgi:hypothetical protein
VNTTALTALSGGRSLAASLASWRRRSLPVLGLMGLLGLRLITLSMMVVGAATASRVLPLTARLVIYRGGAADLEHCQATGALRFSVAE